MFDWPMSSPQMMTMFGRVDAVCTDPAANAREVIGPNATINAADAHARAATRRDAPDPSLLTISDTPWIATRVSKQRQSQASCPRSRPFARECPYGPLSALTRCWETRCRGVAIGPSVRGARLARRLPAVRRGVFELMTTRNKSPQQPPRRPDLPFWIVVTAI